MSPTALSLALTMQGLILTPTSGGAVQPPVVPPPSGTSHVLSWQDQELRWRGNVLNWEIV